MITSLLSLIEIYLSSKIDRTQFEGIDEYCGAV